MHNGLTRTARRSTFTVMKTHTTRRGLAPGGPRRGAGRPRRVAEEWRRQHRVSVLVSPRQLAELHQIADAWDVPPATVAWSFIETALAKARRSRPELGDVAMPLVAACETLQRRIPERPE